MSKVFSAIKAHQPLWQHSHGHRNWKFCNPAPNLLEIHLYLESERMMSSYHHTHFCSHPSSTDLKWFKISQIYVTWVESFPSLQSFAIRNTEEHTDPWSGLYRRDKAVRYSGTQIKRMPSLVITFKTDFSSTSWGPRVSGAGEAVKNKLATSG